MNISVDEGQLNTDRWSAFDLFIRAVLNNEYPYNLKDHLGQTSSNLPGLFFVGLPFYLLGDIGLLQPFVFLLSCMFLYKTKITFSNKLMILFLLLMSPAYMWEIVGKSDLMSNLILLILFMCFWDHKFNKNYFKNTILLAFFCAFFTLTRGIVVIPLTLFLFHDFVKSEKLVKFKFILFYVFFVFIISLPVLLTLPDMLTVIEHNPFNHQTRYAPKLLQLIFIILPFWFSTKVKTFMHVLYFSFLLLALLLFLTFFINVLEEGFESNLYGSLFDISYFGMIIPFAIILMVQSLNKKNTMHA